MLPQEASLILATAVQKFSVQQKNTSKQLRPQARPLGISVGLIHTLSLHISMAPHPKELSRSQRPQKAYSLKKIGREGVDSAPSREPAGGRACFRSPGFEAPLPGGKLSQASHGSLPGPALRNHMLISGNPGLSPRVRRFKKDVGAGGLSSAKRLRGRGILS